MHHGTVGGVASAVLFTETHTPAPLGWGRRITRTDMFLEGH